MARVVAPAESLYSAVNESMIGDHGGGQKEIETLAARMDAKYAPKGTHVYYSGAPYFKVRQDFDACLKANHLPLSTHAGIPDTSRLMYLAETSMFARTSWRPATPFWRPDRSDPKIPRVNNGVTGDPRPSTPEIGKCLFDMRVDAVEEIQRLIRSKR